ncbi:hypothetical protein QBC34DRAFT_8895 [Podospora aff. communis PSN243]|uniref:Uncharacterized protein n=1 Tax=Podospora aff. communis PSN243 TaxID=3040156 RepID=A0AAV9HAG7_9PEZI|nr:hypothetical protein QBC34DRAFT_8895 [Podospora aff. communis PSN243]
MLAPHTPISISPEVSDAEPPSARYDGVEDEEDIYGDQDGLQSLMQPSISPIATRLTSARTPAAEKAAAMEDVPGGGLFDHTPDQVAADHSERPGPVPYQGKPLPDGQPTPPAELPLHLPSPWEAGPREFSVAEPTPPITPSASGFFQSRQMRSSSISENALKRLSKALPTISIPANLIPNISTPSFFASFGASFQKDGQTAPSSHYHHVPRSADPGQFLPLTPGPAPGPSAPPETVTRGLRKSTSHESLLYHSLSRVSSFGDDERFAHVREQVNSRFKAIKDSFDGPSFKMPQIHSMFRSLCFLNAPPKKPINHPTIDGHRSVTAPAIQRISRDGGSALDSVLESMTGDVVVMGGYRGSILRSARAPHRRLWVPVKVGLKIRKVNMEVGLDPRDEEDMENYIFASGMLQNIGPVDISRRLFKKLRECENARNGRLRVHDYGYDWRLSPHLLSRKLVSFLKTLASNQPGVSVADRGALVIAHSLGGLITRHAVNQHPELFSGVVFAGTPQRCINVLGPLRNGDAVLLNEKVLTAQVNLTLRTTFAFLPEDGFCFIDKITKEEYPVDFYNADDWVKYRLSPCVSGPALPPLSRSSSALGSLLSLSESLPSLPLRGRSNSHQHKKSGPGIDHTQEHNAQAGAAVSSAGSVPPVPNNTPLGQRPSEPSLAQQARFISYLRRTLAEIKQFRAELAHDAKHQEANRYPPFAVIYGKDVPTVYAARVAGREGIVCADAYDDLVFRGGDGVVLAREAMLPAGYELVKEGRICTDRGHVSMLGDLNAVGRAVGAVIRGRGKGIGIGTQ